MNVRDFKNQAKSAVIQLPRAAPIHYIGKETDISETQMPRQRLQNVPIWHIIPPLPPLSCPSSLWSRQHWLVGQSSAAGPGGAKLNRSLNFLRIAHFWLPWAFLCMRDPTTTKACSCFQHPPCRQKLKWGETVVTEAIVRGFICTEGKACCAL